MAHPERMPEYREGYQAASERKSFKDYCPYTYEKTGLPHTDQGQDIFNRQWRWKMDAWFAGWKAYLDEHGLRFDFEPPKTKGRD